MEPGRLSVAELASDCGRETEKFRRGDAFSEGSCLELFRRATCERDQHAWSALLDQYRGIVLAWVGRHPVTATLDEPEDYWVNRTFERFWQAVGPERFGAFANLAAILGYLKMCAHSVVMDDVRARGAARLEPLPDVETEQADESADQAGVALDNVARREFWATIGAELHDESERLLVYLSFVLGYKPQEVQKLHPERYAAVADVYRIKRNVLDRLRRSPALRTYLE
jgi:hypothetical protein